MSIYNTFMPFFLFVECFLVPLVSYDGKPPLEVVAILLLSVGCHGLCGLTLGVDGSQTDKFFFNR